MYMEVHVNNLFVCPLVTDTRLLNDDVGFWRESKDYLCRVYKRLRYRIPCQNNSGHVLLFSDTFYMEYKLLIGYIYTLKGRAYKYFLNKLSKLLDLQFVEISLAGDVEFNGYSEKTYYQ